MPWCSCVSLPLFQRVKILGALAMIDDGETDWKVIVVAEGTALYKACDSCADLEDQRPGLLDGLREWFRLYKTAEVRVALWGSG